MLLPHLAKDPGVQLRAVATATALSAANARSRFGFERAVTDADAVIEDTDLDAVLIATRHHTHASLVCQALETGKAVFVEKPLALSEEELAAIVETVARTGNDRLMVGFNRRFAPLLVDLQRRFGPTTTPLALRYLVNAGPLAADSWYRDTAREGSRFAGEGGHFIDTLAAWVGAPPTSVHAVGDPAGDLQTTLSFADGSTASLTYAASGTARAPKEVLDVTGEGRCARLDNFASATVWTPRGREVRRQRFGQDKGQRAELAAFAEAVRTGGPMPIPLASLLSTTRATLAVGASLVSGTTVAL
jgi:predicted dehydrogenase